MSSPQRNKRREMDVMKLLMSDWKVELVNESTKEFEVEFTGPSESPYEGGRWTVRVDLPDDYPYKSPSIGFKNRIYHPNVDESAGSVCLDVINQTWSPLFGAQSAMADLVNVFEVFLPQLLLYPNPTDPLNGEAAALMLREPDAYKKKIRDHVQKYARGGALAKGNAPTPKQKCPAAKHEHHVAPPPAAVHADSPALDSSLLTSAHLDTSGTQDKQTESAGNDDDDEMLGLLSDSDEDA